MNWFERYGIVGAYFVMLVSLWVKVLSAPFKFEPNEYTLIAAILTISFVPLGYIISILSQRIYYSPQSWWRSLFGGGTQIHQQIIKSVTEEKKKNLEISGVPDEADCETSLTSYTRLSLDKDCLESRKYLATFATRRWDVLSINKSIILATWLSPLSCLLLLFSPRLNFNKAVRNFLGIIPKEILLVIILLMLLFTVIQILISSNKILAKQITHVAIDLLKDKKKDADKTSK